MTANNIVNGLANLMNRKQLMQLKVRIQLQRKKLVGWDLRLELNLLSQLNFSSEANAISLDVLQKCPFRSSRLFGL